MITIYAFHWVPPLARGLVRDLRLRWALEEAGLSYKTRLVELGDHKKPDYRALQPFGQIPVYEEDGQVIFESGAGVLHIGGKSQALLPTESFARARATQWMFAALNSVEPSVMEVIIVEKFNADDEWAKLRAPSAREFAQTRVAEVAAALGDKPYLDGDRFTAGDLMMASVLRIVPDLVRDANLQAYVERCTARPAFQRALAAQYADFKPDPQTA